MSVPSASIGRWLSGRFHTQANLCVGLVPVAFLGSLVGLFLTWWLCFMAVYLGLHALGAVANIFEGHGGRVPYRWVVTGAWTGFVLLVGSYFRNGTTGLDEYPEFEDADNSWGNAARLHVIGGGAAVLLMFPHASARMILDILYIAPRMLRGSWLLLRSSGQLRAQDVEPAAEILAALAALPGKIGWDELSQRFGHVPMSEVFKAMRWIPGVVSLEGGLTLDADLRSELRAVIATGSEVGTESSDPGEFAG